MSLHFRSHAIARPPLTFVDCNRLDEIKADTAFVEGLVERLRSDAATLHAIAQRGRENCRTEHCDLWMECEGAADDLDFQVEKALPAVLRELRNERDAI